MESEKVYYLGFVADLGIFGALSLVVGVIFFLLHTYITPLFWIYLTLLFIFVFFMIVTLIKNSLRKTRLNLQQKSDHI